jgi:hypothetical protein
VCGVEGTFHVGLFRPLHPGFQFAFRIERITCSALLFALLISRMFCTKQE